MEFIENRSKHDLYVGIANGDHLEENFNIGYAFKYDHENHFILKLWPLPGATFYLCKNRAGERYTVFAKMLNLDAGEVKFQNPVGFGVLRPELKDYIEVNLRLPKQKIYMSLFPSN